MEDKLLEITEEIILAEKEKENNEIVSRQYYHYTKMNTLFDILEGDSFWVSNIRFSNDYMEEKMIPTDDYIYRDDYVLCFCQVNDILSQWRGYCFDGGASIKLDIRKNLEYSILHADYEMSKKYEIVKNRPLPVVYVDTSPQSVMYDLKKKVQDEKYEGITLRDVVPFIKNNKFNEEKEFRMVFSNVDGELSRCIRFRTLSNGVKVPYVVVKCGDIGKMFGTCRTEIAPFRDDCYIEQIIDNSDAIWIEEGFNQGEVYFEIMRLIDSYKKRNNIDDKVRVYCKGHLPIDKITVAPTIDIERVAEQIKRFCKSKYWLRNVDIEKSTIPYIKPLS